MKDRVIIAADSRGGTTSNGSVVNSTNDGYCEATTFGGYTVFAAAGLLGSAATDWTAKSEMLGAIGNTPGRIGSEDGAAALNRWTLGMRRRLAMFSAEQLVAVSRPNDGKIVSAVLAGIDADGSVWLRGADIRYAEDSALPAFSLILRQKGAETAYFVLGKSAVAFEFLEGSSERAVSERKSWQAKKLVGAEFERFKTKRLVELTIQHHASSVDVGGPIDEIEVDAHGVRWLQVKPACGQQGDTVKSPISENPSERKK